MMTAATCAGAASSLRSNKTALSTVEPQPEYLVVGEILRPHGLRGEVRMRILTDYPENLRRLDHVYLGRSPDDRRLEKRALEGLRFHKQFALLTLAGCSSREDAEYLRGKSVLIHKEQAPPLADGEYYLYQLIGLKVLADAEEIGRIKQVLQTGANDVYVVQTEQHGEALLPAHAETIDEIDFEAGVVRMSLPEGLLPAE